MIVAQILAGAAALLITLGIVGVILTRFKPAWGRRVGDWFGKGVVLLVLAAVAALIVTLLVRLALFAATGEWSLS